MAYRSWLLAVAIRTDLGVLLAAAAVSACSAPLQRTAAVAPVAALRPAERRANAADAPFWEPESATPLRSATLQSLIRPLSDDRDGCRQELLSRGVAFVPLQH